MQYRHATSLVAPSAVGAAGEPAPEALPDGIWPSLAESTSVRYGRLHMKWVILG
jgi:hypothetical protein